MRRLAIALSIAVLGTAHATEVHNGIRFDMKREDLERMGFVCRASTSEFMHGRIECAHMEMTGRAFSQQLDRYQVYFNKDGAISQIYAMVVQPPRGLNGLLLIGQEIQKFYPLEYQFPEAFKAIAPLTFRYYEPEGSAVQMSYLESARAISISFFPKGTVKP